MSSRERWSRRAPLLPALIFTVIVTQVPFVLVIWYSLHGWNTLQPGSNTWVGLKEYRLLFSDPLFGHAVINTIIIAGCGAIVSMVLGVMFAVMLNRRFRGRGLARTLLITPFLVVPAASALLYKTSIFDSTYGLLNWVLGPFGVHHVNWIGSHSVVAVVMVLVWEWTPFMMLIVLGGLQGESVEVLEAASVDGANAVQSFFRITLPHITKYIELALLLGSIYIIQTWAEVFILTQGGGGASGTATTNLPYYIYQLAFNQFNVSEAAAAGVIVVIGTEVIATFVLKLLGSLFADTEVLG